MASKKRTCPTKNKNCPTKSKGISVLQNKNKDKKSGGAFAPPILQNYPSIWCEDHTFQVAFLIIVTSNFIE
mgnify:CR=1 FL=1